MTLRALADLTLVAASVAVIAVALVVVAGDAVAWLLARRKKKARPACEHEWAKWVECYEVTPDGSRVVETMEVCRKCRRAARRTNDSRIIYLPARKRS